MAPGRSGVCVRGPHPSSEPSRAASTQAASTHGSDLRGIARRATAIGVHVIDRPPMVLNFTHLASAAVAVLVGSGAASAELRHGPTLLPPVAGACISSPFGPRVLPNRPQAGIYHYGVDLPAAAGAPVLAIAAGTVIRIQDKGPGGLEMLVQHDGFLGIYSHFGVVAPAFAEGKRAVAAGEKLGVVGTTGVTTGAHLYFQMDLAGKPVDPAPYLGVRPCNGETHQTASIDRMDTDEKIVGTRTVHVLLPVAQPYQLPRQ